MYDTFSRQRIKGERLFRVRDMGDELERGASIMKGRGDTTSPRRSPWIPSRRLSPRFASEVPREAIPLQASINREAVEEPVAARGTQVFLAAAFGRMREVP